VTSRDGPGDVAGTLAHEISEHLISCDWSHSLQIHVARAKVLVPSPKSKHFTDSSEVLQHDKTESSLERRGWLRKRVLRGRKGFKGRGLNPSFKGGAKSHKPETHNSLNTKFPSPNKAIFLVTVRYEPPRNNVSSSHPVTFAWWRDWWRKRTGDRDFPVGRRLRYDASYLFVHCRVRVGQIRQEGVVVERQGETAGQVHVKPGGGDVACVGVLLVLFHQSVVDSCEELHQVSASTCCAHSTTFQPRGLQTFLSEDHIIYYVTLRLPDMFPSEIVSGYVTFYQINKRFVNMLVFITDKMTLRQDKWLRGPDLARRP